MHPCPHCSEHVVSTIEKWISSPVTPARCRSCGKLFYVSHLANARSKAIASLIAGTGICLGAYAHSLAAVGVSLVLGVAAYVALRYLSPLSKTTGTEVIRQQGYIVASLYIAAAAGATWLVYHFVV
jgi:hypothetical protein